jgi:putative transposase
MSDYRRLRIPGGQYFFTLVTKDRAPLFKGPAEVEVLRTALRQVMRARPFRLQATVVLPDHLHCIWQLPPGDADFSGRWREVKKAVYRGLHRPLPQTGSIWQPRFWEHLLRDADDWRRHMDYIHYNPVKHGLATSPLDWPWSSFRHCVACGWYEPNWGAGEPATIASMHPE